MKGWAERLLALAAVVVVISFLAGVAGWRSAAGGGKAFPDGGMAYYHDGKTTAAVNPGPGCLGGECHVAYPHAAGPEAAFRNLHVAFVECRVCHGPEGASKWRADRGEDGRWRIRAGPGPGADDPHREFGVAVRCRGCHSDAGRARIEEGSPVPLPGTFRNPVALRMLEEGPRTWVPGSM